MVVDVGAKDLRTDVVNVDKSPSFKQIIENFSNEHAGVGLHTMYKKVKDAYKGSLKKRNTCEEKQTTKLHKWDSLKDKVLEVRRDIRKKMIRKAELGQLSKPGMLFLQNEELMLDVD